MRYPSVNVVVLLLLSVVSHSQAGLFGDKLNKFKNNASARPRRRLTDVPQEPVDHDAATGTVKGAPEDTTKGTCDGQLAQALVAANDKEQQLRIELDAAVNAKAAALESIVQLEAQVEEAKGNMGDFQLKQEEEIKALKAQLATASSETVTAVTAAETTKDTVIRKLEAQLDEAKGDVQTEMEVKLKDAEVLLETTRQEAKRVLVEQVATVKEQMKEMESQAKAALAKKDETISDIKKQNERFSKYNQEMLEAKKTYETELEHWRNTFEKRSYCNMTHIGDDLYETTLSAYSQAVDAASVAAAKATEVATVAATKAKEATTVAAEQLNVHSRKLAKEASVHAQYGYKKAAETADVQYKQHWPKIEPHYNEHVAPLVGKFTEWKSKEVDPKLESLKTEYLKIKTKEIDPRLETLNTERKKLFAKMVELYGTYCQESYKFTLEMAKENNFMEQFQKVGPSMKASCDQAEYSMTVLFRAMLILILLPFTGRIFGLAWAIVRFPLRLALSIFLTVTLLRFILPSRSSSPPKGKEPPSPNKVKSNAGVNNKKRSQRTQ